ncbi:MAG TPA: hypothetical protein VGO49_17115 [Bradyrhizobium sp.]|jgi:hypothetical protein|nr:hypothetical protein [Bradyrhizobium sp.]
MKEEIVAILRTETDACVRFEMLENFYEAADSEADILLLLSILNNDEDPCVRHEAAAQLFRIEEKKSHLFSPMTKNMAIKSLFTRAKYDESVVVRHESIEALGYLVDFDRLGCFDSFVQSENLDIQSTAKISAKVARYRIEKNIPASSIGACFAKERTVPELTKQSGV